MTMHLHHPSLSLNGKKKGKKKFRNADQAREARERDKAWNELLKKYGADQDACKRNRALTSKSYKPPVLFRRETEYIPSKNSTNMGPCTKAQDKVYTGNKIVGIGTMHKSNAVPIFSDQEAKDISTMRR